MTHPELRDFCIDFSASWGSTAKDLEVYQVLSTKGIKTVLFSLERPEATSLTDRVPPNGWGPGLYGSTGESMAGFHLKQPEIWIKKKKAQRLVHNDQLKVGSPWSRRLEIRKRRYLRCRNRQKGQLLYEVEDTRKNEDHSTYNAQTIFARFNRW